MGLTKVSAEQVVGLGVMEFNLKKFSSAEQVAGPGAMKCDLKKFSAGQVARLVVA